MNTKSFYVIKDEFFAEMNDQYLKGNKDEHRPHYYCIEDKVTGIYWMIPLSSKIDKFKKIVAKKEQNGKSCDLIHILKLDNNRESAFLIQDMFPVTEQYIQRTYTIASNPLCLTSEKSAKTIEKKARKVLGLIKNGIKFMPTQPDVMAIYKKLIANIHA